MKMYNLSIVDLKKPFFIYFQRNVNLCLCCAMMFVLIGCGNKSKENHDFYKNKTAIEVNINQMLFACTENGASLIDLTKIEDCSVRYRWRSWSKGHTNELSGCGMSMQEVRPIIKVGNSSFGISSNMVFGLAAGRVNLLWTPGSSNTVWLYYSPKKTVVRLLSDVEFESFRAE
jgi:hypothetical protein